MITMSAMNWNRTRRRISFCEVQGEPPRAIFARPSTSTIATAMIAIGTRIWDMKSDITVSYHRSPAMATMVRSRRPDYEWAILQDVLVAIRLCSANGLEVLCRTRQEVSADDPSDDLESGAPCCCIVAVAKYLGADLGDRKNLCRSCQAACRRTAKAHRGGRPQGRQARSHPHHARQSQRRSRCIV